MLTTERCMGCKVVYENTQNTPSGNVQNAQYNSHFRHLRNSGRLYDEMAYAVLTNSNEQAMEVLNASGKPRFIPGTYFTSLIEISRFYGVKEKYLLGVMHRWGISAQKTPEDFIRERPPWFLLMQEVDDRVTICQFNDAQGYTLLCDKENMGGEGVEILPEVTSRQYFISARVVLALSALMYYGRNMTTRSQAWRTLEVLYRCQYIWEVEPFKSPQPREPEPPVAEELAVSPPAPAPEEASEGTISSITLAITPEILEAKELQFQLSDDSKEAECVEEPYDADISVEEQPKPSCPECGEPIIFENGCSVCRACGWSKCS